MSKEEDTRRELLEDLKQLEEAVAEFRQLRETATFTEPTRRDGARFELAPRRGGIRERA